MTTSSPDSDADSSLSRLSSCFFQSDLSPCGPLGRAESGFALLEVLLVTESAFVLLKELELEVGTAAATFCFFDLEQHGLANYIYDEQLRLTASALAVTHLQPIVNLKGISVS